MFQKINKSFAIVLLLLLIEAILMVFNVIPGTYLVGWDNLYPELHLANNIKMNFFSIWQEYRGLGVQDAMAHSANLLHTLFIGLLASFLPQSMIRYFFQFLMHFAGGVGMFFLLQKTFKKNHVLSFIGALFYQYNLGTIQMFYAPFEAFSIHFAALPWLLFALINLISHPSKKNIIIFSLISFITTPQSLIPTLFIAYGILVASVLGINLIIRGKKSIRTSLIIAIITLSINAFWLFPFIHGALHQGKIVSQTKINQLSSDIIFERNNKRGTFIDTLLLRGFMLDISEDDTEGDHVYIMKQWKDYTAQPIIVAVQLVFAGLMISGIFSLLKNHNRTKENKEWYTLPAFAFAFVMLSTQTPLLSSINSFMRDTIPLFGEAFRFPFTKFILLYVLIYTVLLVYGLQMVFHFYNNAFKHKLLALVLPLMIVLSVLPAFQGGFFYGVERLAIPRDYFKVIDYFAHEPTDRRIMTLPQTSFWNWMYYRWGARGSGFAWYGIAQAQLERPFDPWSNYNEQYLNELVYALQKLDASLFKNVINKYDISYILIDENVLHISKIQQKEKLEEFIQTIYPDAEKHSFERLTVYKLPQKTYVTVKVNPQIIGSQFGYSHDDQIYKDYGDYIYGEDWETSYLFPTLFTNKTQQDLEFDFSVQNDRIIFIPHEKIKIPNNNHSYQLTVDRKNTDETLIPLLINSQSEGLSISSIPVYITLNNDIFIISDEKENIFPLPKKPIKKLTLNGQDIAAVMPNMPAYFYSDAENTLIIEFSDTTKESITYIPTANQQRAYPLTLNAGQIEQTVSLPITRPDDWNYGNLFEVNTYQIEAPCKDQIHSTRSLYEESNNTITLTSEESAVCFHQFLDNIEQTLGFYIYLNTENITGMPLEAVVDNPQTKTNVLETQLNGNTSEKLLIVPPTNRYIYENYGFHLRNVSVSRNETKNILNEMNIGYLPYDLLKTIKITRNDLNSSQELVSDYDHPAQYIYRTTLTQTPSANNILYLSQSFHSGWKAYSVPQINNLTSLFPFFFGQELSEHTLVNNWANGWKINSQNETTHVVIIFWPQYLQFAGFIILIITLIGVSIIPSSRFHSHRTD